MATTDGLIHALINRETHIVTPVLTDHGFPSGWGHIEYNPTEKNKHDLLISWYYILIIQQNIEQVKALIKDKEYNKLRDILGKRFDWVRFADEQITNIKKVDKV